jgi:hypothetical protein
MIDDEAALLSDIRFALRGLDPTEGQRQTLRRICAQSLGAS